MSEKLARLRNVLREKELDAVVITHLSNRFYLSGFLAEDHPPNESAGHLVISQDRAVLVTSPIEAENAANQAPDFDIAPVTREKPGLAANDAEVLRSMGAQRVGFEDSAILYRDYRTIKKHLDEEVELVAVGNMVDNLRAVKSQDEIEKLAHVLRVTDEALARVEPTITAGESEKAIGWRIEQAFRELGAKGAAFPTIVASGPNAALPHHPTGDRLIQEGEPIIIDMGAYVDGYCGDLTRTLWVGEPDPKLREIYQIVYDSLEAAEAGIKPGMTGKEADAISRSIIERAGYGDQFIHSLGHGLGVRVHESPSLSPRYNEVLKPGHVVTVEPGIYIPGWGGVRIEDVGVITEDGIDIFTTAPKRSV
ncbi:MAG: aminopeptidase P family protein [Thermomicrobiaceae bacterium]